MKSPILLFIIISLNVSSCKKESIDQKIDFSSSFWQAEEKSGFGTYLELTKNGKFQKGFSGEGCGIQLNGEYQLLEKAIRFSPKSITECGSGDKLDTFECSIMKASDTIFRNVYIDCGKFGTFWNRDSIVPIGTARKLGTFDILTMGLVSTEIKENAKIRKEPKKTAQNFQCKYQGTQPQDFISAGTKVEVIARTLDKSKVDNWENYWYYLRTEEDWYGDGCPTGWVFGEFVKL